MAVISKDSIIIELDIQGQAKVAEMEGQLSKLESKTNSTKGKFSDMSGSISKASDQIKNKITQAFPEAEGAINRVSGAIGGLKSSGEKGAGGIFTLGNALRLLGGGVIGLVIGAVGALVSYLSKLDPVLDKIEQLTAGVSEGFSVLGSRVLSITEGLGSFLTGNFSEGITKIADSFRGLGGAISEAGKRGANLKAILQEIEDTRDITEAQIAERNGRVKVLNAEYRSATVDRKLEINQEILKLETDNLNVNDKLVKRENDALIEQVKLNDKKKVLSKSQLEQLRSFNSSSVQLANELLNSGIITPETYKKIQDQFKRQQQLRDDSLAVIERSESRIEKLNTDLQSKRDKAEQDRLKALEKAKAEQEKIRQDQIKGQGLLNQAEIDVLEDGLNKRIEQLDLKRDADIKAFNELKGINERQKQQFERLINERFVKDVNATIEAEAEAFRKLKEQRQKELKEIGEIKPISLNRTDTNSEASAQLKRDIEARKKAKEQADSIAKIDQEANQKKLDLAIQTEQQVSEVAFDYLNQLSDARINAIDSEINAQQSKIDRFRELAEFGTAEQLQLEEDRLARLQKAREQEVERSRKIAAIQIALNQAVSLSESIKAITTAFGTDPTGITAILKGVALTATIGSTLLAVGNAFGALPAFKGGTDYVQGQGTETSDSILARLSKGERVVPAHENKELRTNGIITTKDLVRYAKIGRALGDRNDIVPQSGKDYTDALNNLVAENRLMRKKLESLEIHMGISSEGVYGLITSMAERSNKLQKLKD